MTPGRHAPRWVLQPTAERSRSVEHQQYQGGPACCETDRRSYWQQPAIDGTKSASQLICSLFGAMQLMICPRCLIAPHAMDTGKRLLISSSCVLRWLPDPGSSPAPQDLSPAPPEQQKRQTATPSARAATVARATSRSPGRLPATHAPPAARSTRRARPAVSGYDHPADPSTDVLLPAGSMNTF